MESLQQENVELRRKLGLEPSGETPQTFVKAKGSALDVQLGGFIQAVGEFGDPGDGRWTGQAVNDRIYLRRARIHVAGHHWEEFAFRLQGDYAGICSEQSNQRFQLTDGWIGWNRYNFANLKAGQFFPAYGHEKRLNPLLLETVELSLPAFRLLPERQLGAQLTHRPFVGERPQPIEVLHFVLLAACFHRSRLDEGRDDHAHVGE